MKVFSLWLIIIKWKVKCVFYAITEENIIDVKIRIKRSLSRSGQFGYVTWINMEGHSFLSEYVPHVGTSHSRYIPGDRAGLLSFWNATVFKLRINSLDSVYVTLLSFSALFSILSHCVREHVSTRFIRLRKYNNTMLKMTEETTVRNQISSSPLCLYP